MRAHDILICFSHQRWDSLSPHTRRIVEEAASDRQVYFVEEPVFGGDVPSFELYCIDYQLLVMRPILPPGTDKRLIPDRMSYLLGELLYMARVESYTLWFCTPMAMAFARDMTPAAVVYDLGSELPELDESAGLAAYHTQLLAAADLVIDDASSITWNEVVAAIEPQREAAA